MDRIKLGSDSEASIQSLGEDGDIEGASSLEELEPNKEFQVQ